MRKLMNSAISRVNTCDRTTICTMLSRSSVRQAIVQDSPEAPKFSRLRGRRVQLSHEGLQTLL